MHMPSIGPKAKLPLPAQSSHSLQQLRITYGTEHRRQEGLLSPWPYSALVPTEVKSQGAYAVISLFDGASTTVDIIQSKFAQRPTVLLAAENDPDIRRQVCSIKGYDANEQWRRCEAGYPVCYASDVCNLFAHRSQLIREFVSLCTPEIQHVYLVAG